MSIEDRREDRLIRRIAYVFVTALWTTYSALGTWLIVHFGPAGCNWVSDDNVLYIGRVELIVISFTAAAPWVIAIIVNGRLRFWTLLGLALALAAPVCAYWTHMTVMSWQSNFCLLS